MSTKLFVRAPNMKAFRKIREEISRVIHFPDGVTRVVFLERRDWEMLDLHTRNGLYPAILNRSILGAAEWQGRDDKTYDHYVRLGLRDLIRAHRDIRHNKHSANNNGILD